MIQFQEAITAHPPRPPLETGVRVLQALTFTDGADETLTPSPDPVPSIRSEYGYPVRMLIIVGACTTLFWATSHYMNTARSRAPAVEPPRHKRAAEGPQLMEKGVRHIDEVQKFFGVFAR